METQRGRGREILRERLDQAEKTIRRVARNLHLNPEDEKELKSLVLLKLARDGETVFRRYRGEARFETYLSVLVRRVWLDHRTREWGRWRPSAQATRMGLLAVALDQRIHRDGLEPAEAIEDLLIQNGPNQRETLERLADALPYRPRRDPISIQERLDTLPAPQATEGRLEASERRNQCARLQRLMERLIQELPEEDQDLLRRRFGQGWTVRRIAIHRGQGARPLYRRFERILRQIRRGLEQGGMQWSSVGPTLEAHRAELDLFIQGFSETSSPTQDSANG